MIEFSTDRMIAKSDIIVENGLFCKEKHENIIDILNLTPCNGREDGFVFYDKNNTENEICHIGFVSKRGKFEISYETKEEYRNKGFMTEAVGTLCQWIFQSTSYKEIWALPSNMTSVGVLKRNGFVRGEKLSSQTNMFWYFKKAISTQKVENK